jgi:PTH1 family peptidyl-tRNA hydrolase
MADRRILVAGLGNPGGRYQHTRHNAGFLAVGSSADREGISLSREKMGGHYATLRLADRQVILVQPQLYMNRSGECVGRFAEYYSVATPDILVVHDDLDLPPGRIKLTLAGGAGGHKGVRSLIDVLGSSDFARLKIGIGHPRNVEETAAMPVEKYVLARFSDREWELMQETLQRVEEGIRIFIREGSAAAMNLVNRRISPPQ